jgi:hypothetical protein
MKIAIVGLGYVASRFLVAASLWDACALRTAKRLQHARFYENEL